LTDETAPPAGACPWGLIADLSKAVTLEQVASRAVDNLARLCRARGCAFVLRVGRGVQVVRTRQMSVPLVRHVMDRVGSGRFTGARLEKPYPRMVAFVVSCADFDVCVLLRGPELDSSWLEGNLEGLGDWLRASVERMLVSGQEDNPTALLSHEMRTPLTSIQGYATALLREDFASDPMTVKEFARLIAEEADALGLMVAEVLEANSPKVTKLRLDREPVLAPKMVQAAVREASDRDPRHRYVCCLAGKLPLLWADPGRLKQVLRNLLDNAAKYAVPGLVVVRAEADGDEVRFSVADEGPGLKPEHVNRLFERYFRVKQDSTAVPGTGLGLPLARVIVERHGGRIWAVSEEGKGTTFSFTILVWRDQGDAG